MNGYATIAATTATTIKRITTHERIFREPRLEIILSKIENGMKIITRNCLGKNDASNLRNFAILFSQQEVSKKWNNYNTTSKSWYECPT